MSWIDAVQNGQGVLAVFGGDAPPLTGSRWAAPPPARGWLACARA
jgi:hypothetical protein